MQRELVSMFNLLTLNIRPIIRVNYYLNTIGDQIGKELGNEYIATEAEALKEESVAFVAEIDVLKCGPSAARGTICKK